MTIVTPGWRRPGFISSLRDDAPWLYEVGYEVYQAARSGDRERLALTLERFERWMHSPVLRHLVDGPELDMAVHELPHVARHFLWEAAQAQSRPPKSLAKLKQEAVRR